MSIERESFRTLAEQALDACCAAGLSVVRGRVVLRSLAPAEILDRWVDSEFPARSASSREPAELGALYERALAASQRAAKKRRGSFYTPPALARKLCEIAFASRAASRVLDPACGAGAILLGALGFVSHEALHGVDIDPVAVWIARVSLALASRSLEDDALARWSARVRVGDALAPETFADEPLFDAVIGNPPWVSYAGRSAEPVSDEQRKYWRKSFRSFSGFPTAQGMFVERAASLLDGGGRLALLVPTPMADLDGYARTREALTRVAALDASIEELGFDQFESVVQPTMIVAATARALDDRHDTHGSPAPWRLAGADESQRPALAPSLLSRLASLPRFSRDTFGEGGFQTAGTIARTHLGSPLDDPRFSVLLREGADVIPFACSPPTLALDPDPAAMAAARCSLRSMDFYARVSVVIRQTARFPVAARHDPPHAFRNSLLAGFSDDPLVLCALLNSSLLRSVHLHAQRDGRQAVFPQLKVSHLRALPAPPAGAPLDALRASARRAEEAQLRKLSAIRAYGPAPRTAFESKGASVAPSEAFVRSLKDPAQRARFDEALSLVRAAHARAFAAMSECDSIVFALYDVTDEERATALSVLGGRS